MKRTSLLLALTLMLALQLQAQCGGKGLKAIDAKDYKTAWTSLEECLQSDADDISANFGMSRLYGSDPAKKDKGLALTHLQKAEAGWAKLDDKGKAKYEKVGITNATMEERRDRIESSHLEAAKAANTVAGYEAFLIAFPDSKSTNACRNYRNDLAYKLAQATGTVDALDEYLTTYPDAENAADVTKARDLLATSEALKANTEDAFTNFLRRYPNAMQAPQIQQKLNAVAFENAKTANTIEAYQGYISRFPESVFVMQAREKLEWLQAHEEK
jgi:hypothetical protein